VSSQHPFGHATPAPLARAANEIEGDTMKGSSNWTLRLLGCAAALAVLSSATHAGAAPRSAETRTPRRLCAGVVAGGGGWTSEDNDGFGTFGITVGGHPRRWLRVDGMVTYDDIAFVPDSALGRAFRGARASEVALDVTARLDRGPSGARCRVYPLVGAGVGALYGIYASPVTVVEDGVRRSVDYDGVFYGSLYAGAGVSFTLGQRMTVGGQLVGGQRFYDRSMGSGARNGLLADTGFARILLEATWQLH
jgi:hypothetical protein